jgi:O-antigen/teichoic acid export membrane protein
MLRGRFIGDSLRYAPSVLIPAAAGVASVTIFTRLLSPDGYGVYSMVMAAVAILSMVAAGWIEQSVLRYVPERGDTAAHRVMRGHVLGLTLATCAVVTLLLLAIRFAAAAHLGAYAGVIIPGAILLLGEAAFVALAAVLMADLRSHLLSTLRIAGALLRLAGSLGFVLWIGRDAVWLIAGAAVGRGIVTIITLWVVAHHDGHWVRPSFDRPMLRRFAAYGVPMVGWAMGSQLLALSDRFVIGAFAGSAAVGIYSANYNLVSMGFGLLNTPLLMAAHPLIVNAWKERDARSMPAVIASFARLYVYAVMPLLVVLALCSSELAQVLLGAAFREGNFIVPILVLGMMVRGFSMYGHKGLELAERTHIMFVLVAISAAFNVLLNLIFVPIYGYTAAAWTTVAGYLLYPILVHRASRSHVPWLVPWRTILVSLAAGLISAAAGYAARRALIDSHPLVIIAATGVITLAVYVGLIALALRTNIVPSEGRA